MGLLLYAITTPPAAEPWTRIDHVDVDGLTAWIRDIGAEASPFTRQDLVEHHAVLSEVFEQVQACLPARFPTVLANEAALRRNLVERGAELTQQLEDMRGACELALTAVWAVADEEAPAAVEGTSPGRAYLLRRQTELSASERRHARAEELADALEREAGPRLRQAARHVCPSKEVALSLALLVDRVSVGDVRERLQNLVSRDVRILVHGPWPPYTFVGLRSRSAK